MVVFLLLALVVSGMVPATLPAQEARALAGVVVDAASGRPVADVQVAIEGTSLRSVTDSDGRFRIAGVPAGNARLVVRHVAYGEHGRAIVVEDAGALEFRIAISQQAIELAPLEVEVLSDAELARRASGTSIDLIDRPTIDEFASRGESLVQILGREVPGIRINGGCVEYRLQSRTRGIGVPDPDSPESRDPVSRNCRGLAVYLDGVRTSTSLHTFALEQFERIEVLSPIEAGVRFGMMGGYGVILLESRQGRLADAPETPVVKVTGFAWSETRPYPWARVLGTSAAFGAMSLGAGYAILRDCVDSDVNLSAQCPPSVATIGGVVTGAVSGLLTRWAGRTQGSEGRMIPSVAAGAASSATGFLLYLKGENQGSDLSRVAGMIVMTVGTPVLLTLTNRVFRQLR